MTQKNQTPAHRLCLDIRTHRVIYFTPDTAYQAPDNGFVYTAEATIPDGMTLANCWQYCFVTGSLVLQTIANRAPRKGDTLQNGNRKALIKALQAKLLALWQAVPPWHTADLPTRTAQFAAIDSAYQTRITAAQDSQIQGLADEIAALTI